MEALYSILTRLKKNPNRSYSKEYIRNIEKIILGARAKIISEKIDLKEYNLIVTKIKAFLITKDMPTDSNNEQQVTMATFDIVTANKLIPEFNGNISQLSNFLGLIELYSSTLTSEQGKSLVKFVLATKLTDNVKNKLLTVQKPETVQDFKQVLSSIFKTNDSVASLHSSIVNLQQGNSSIQTFSSKIESVIAKLNQIQISDQGESSRQIIVNVNDQLALSAFKNGLNQPYKSIVMAARPKSMNEAVQIASESNTSTSQNILYVNQHSKFRGSWRSDHSNNPRARSRNNFVNNRSQFVNNNNRPQSNNNRTNSNRYRHEYYNNHVGNNVSNHNTSNGKNNYWRGRNHNRRIFATQRNPELYQGNE